MDEGLAITGIGLLEPLGHGACATIEDADIARFVGERLRRKLDRFSVLGLCAAGLALEASGLTAAVAPERIGIFVGNCLGGWGFTEPELRRLHIRGVGAMGPYVATAWFPAAVQGQISLAHGIKGHSKTFSHEIGGIAAIGHAMRAIAAGRVDAALCGAVESLDSPYVRAVLASLPDAGFAEGAAFLTIERADRARARGATVHALLTGYAECFASDPATLAEQAERTIRAAAPMPGAQVVRCDGRAFALSGARQAARAAAAPKGFDHAVIHVQGPSGSVASLGLSRAVPAPSKEQEHD